MPVFCCAPLVTMVMTCSFVACPAGFGSRPGTVISYVVEPFDVPLFVHDKTFESAEPASRIVMLSTVKPSGIISFRVMSPFVPPSLDTLIVHVIFPSVEL